MIGMKKIFICLEMMLLILNYKRNFNLKIFQYYILIMLELLSIFENILRFISTVISTGFTVKKLAELKDEYDIRDENLIFIGSLIVGFLLGIAWNYFKK